MYMLENLEDIVHMLSENSGVVYYGRVAVLEKALDNDREYLHLHGSDIVSIGKGDEKLSTFYMPPKSPLPQAFNLAILKSRQSGIFHKTSQNHGTNPSPDAASKALTYNDLILIVVMFFATIVLVLIIFGFEYGLNIHRQDPKFFT